MLVYRTKEIVSSCRQWASHIKTGLGSGRDDCKIVKKSYLFRTTLGRRLQHPYVSLIRPTILFGTKRPSVTFLCWEFSTSLVSPDLTTHTVCAATQQQCAQTQPKVSMRCSLTHEEPWATPETFPDGPVLLPAPSLIWLLKF
jgi:hypothetical protein